MPLPVYRVQHTAARATPSTAVPYRHATGPTRAHLALLPWGTDSGLPPRRPRRRRPPQKPRARGCRSRARLSARSTLPRHHCCLCALPWVASERPVAHYIRKPSRARASTTPGRTRAPGHEQQDGTVVDGDLHLALVVLDAKLVVLDGLVGLRGAVAAPRSRRCRSRRAHLPEPTRPVRRWPEQVVCTLLPIDLIGCGITEAAATPPVTGGSPIR